MEPLVFITVVIIAMPVVILLFIMSMGLDRDRIDSYIRDRGGKVVQKSWKPFGMGWLGEKDSRIYEVQYTDNIGNLHRAHCKTSLFSGVYFTHDTIIKHAGGEVKRSEEKEKPRDRVSVLEEENRRLKEELSRLKSQ